MFRLLGSVNDRLMMIKLLIVNELQQLYWHIYGPQKWLGEDVKDKFHEDLSPLSPLLVKMSWSWLVDINGQVRKNLSGYDGIHGVLGTVLEI